MEYSIQNTYHDALFFASAQFNKNNNFYLTPSDYKVMVKLIHYSTSYEEITFQNKDISNHIFLSETTVKDSIEALLRKGYITSKRYLFNNRLGYKSKRTIFINWLFLEEITKLILINDTSKQNIEKPTSTDKAKTKVLKNDKSKDEPIPQPKEIIAYSEHNKAKSIAQEDMKEEYEEPIEDDQFLSSLENDADETFLDEQGNVIDKYGNIIDEDETPVLSTSTKKYQTKVDKVIEETEQKQAEKKQKQVDLTLTREQWNRMDEPPMTYEEYLLTLK